MGKFEADNVVIVNVCSLASSEEVLVVYWLKLKLNLNEKNLKWKFKI